MKWSVLGLLLLGLVAAFCAALLVSGYSFTEQAKATPQPKDVTIFVAKRELPAVSVVTADLFEERLVPKDQAPPRYISNPAQIIGRVLTVAMVPGQPFTTECFPARRDGVYLASKLPPGKRAVTVSLTDYGGLEDLLYPGCVVDVLASFDLPSIQRRTGEGTAVSTTLLQTVQVLAVDSETVAGEENDIEVGDKAKKAAEKATPRIKNSSRKGLRVTLLVDSRQAEALQLAMEHGAISLAMRNPMDADATEHDPTVLHEGRLARLAEYLEGFKKDEEAELGPETQAVAIAEPEPAPLPEPDARVWEVTIMRGVKSEIQTLEPLAAEGD